ncbi:hypothetical protein ACN47E_007489 [Coniothyrium glycines]
MPENGILLCWANIPSDATEWYEDNYIQAMRDKWAVHALHCEETPNGMENEPIGKLDCPWKLMTVYEVDVLSDVTACLYDTSNHPPEDLFSGILKGARFDVRTYREIHRLQDEDWDESDVSQIISMGAMEWKVRDDAHDQVLEFYKTVVAQQTIASPSVLRHRLFQVDRATVLQENSYVTEETEKLHTYFTLVEFDTEEWPWDIVVEVAADEMWRELFEKQEVVKWQCSHFIVTKAYPPDEKKPS